MFSCHAARDQQVLADGDHGAAETLQQPGGSPTYGSINIREGPGAIWVNEEAKQAELNVMDIQPAVS